MKRVPDAEVRRLKEVHIELLRQLKTGERDGLDLFPGKIMSMEESIAEVSRILLLLETGVTYQETVEE